MALPQVFTLLLLITVSDIGSLVKVGNASRGFCPCPSSAVERLPTEVCDKPTGMIERTTCTTSVVGPSGGPSVCCLALRFAAHLQLDGQDRQHAYVAGEGKLLLLKYIAT